MKRVAPAVAALLLALAAGWAGAQNAGAPPERPRGGHGRRAEVPVLPAGFAEPDGISLVLGRPTATSAVVSVLSPAAREGFIEYGPAAGRYGARTGLAAFPASTPVDLVLENLTGDAPGFYRLRHRALGVGELAAGAEHRFHTPRAPGSPFVFEIQGDSHPERPQMFDALLYARTLRAAAADHPDFYMTIGDDFSVDTLGTANAETVAQRYRLQRPFLALVAQSAALFLVNGNHEQAAACNLDGTSNNVAVWAQTARNAFFPQPAPDGFYSGDATNVPFIGSLRDYYAWTWGDALFVVIDPYWHSPKPVDNVYGGGPKTRDLWSVTLGDEQYAWLARTLATSRARYKFVFAHHVLGTGRGGIEQAGLFEWGGKDKNGVDEFTRRRPGWALPIHPLMAKNGVTIFFQGHDHVFARQQLDGVTYQTLPNPADPNYALNNRDAYRSGDVVRNSGRVRVTVSSEKVRVEYVHSRLPKDATPQHPDGEIAFAYEIAR